MIFSEKPVSTFRDHGSKIRPDLAKGRKMRVQARWRAGAVLTALLPAQFFVLMLGLALMVSGAMPPGVGRTIAAAGHATQARLHIWTDAKGVPQTGPQNQTLSHNWSGYGLSKGGPFTSVQGTWAVPKVSYQKYPGSPGVEVSSTWIGIGGQENDESLIQIGTQQMAAPSGETAYFAWYEILPASETPINPKQYPIAPGDAITATMQCTAGCAPRAPAIWVLTLNNPKRWQRPFTINLRYQSSLASVEWIVEGPCVNNCTAANPGFAYLPNFGSTTFTAITVNNATPKLVLAADGIIMKDPAGNSTSTPSAPSGGGNSFTVSFSI
jgi:hypothetical protein